MQVFRTFNASFTLDAELYALENHPQKKEYMRSETTQLKFYNDANYQVGPCERIGTALMEGIGVVVCLKLATEVARPSLREFNASCNREKPNVLARLETKWSCINHRLNPYPRDTNKQVAILCNHSRAVSKTFDTQMEKMDDKRDEIVKELQEAKKKLKGASAADKDKLKKKVGAPAIVMMLNLDSCCHRDQVGTCSRPVPNPID